jgi:hypothetical protein
MLFHIYRKSHLKKDESGPGDCGLKQQARDESDESGHFWIKVTFRVCKWVFIISVEAAGFSGVIIHSLSAYNFASQVSAQFCWWK